MAHPLAGILHFQQIIHKILSWEIDSPRSNFKRPAISSKDRRALIITYSCTGNTVKVADEAAGALEENGWSVQKKTLRAACSGLDPMPDFVVIGVPVHYFTVPAAASEMLRAMPPLTDVPVFVFCAYGGCIQHHAAYHLASELKAKGARIAGGAVMLTPHSCPVSGGERLGDIDERFGKNEPCPGTIRAFRKAVSASAEKSYKSAFSVTPESLSFSNAGAAARMIYRFTSLRARVSLMPGIKFNEELCTGCGTCIRLCAAGKFKRNENGKARMIKGGCNKCYVCAAQCPSGALSSNWKTMEYMARSIHKLAAGSGSVIIGPE